MMSRRWTAFLIVASVWLLAVASASAEHVLIRCARPCANVVKAIQKDGGTVNYQYKYVDAIAADVSEKALASVLKLVGDGAVTKDLVVPQPAMARDPGGAVLAVQAEAMLVDPLDANRIMALASDPSGYLINNTFLNLEALHGEGTLGNGIRVAVIDSGIRPGFPHLTVDGSVIGGKDFVGDGKGFNHFGNNGHGTFVAGMISANVAFGFGVTSPFLQSVTTHCPSCLAGAGNVVPMLGSAPLSSIYAARVFGPTGGAPTSRILAAMEHVITLRKNFDSGVPETPNPDGSYNSLRIDVVNMSLSGPTLFAGRDLMDQEVEVMLDANIVPVISAANAGPSGSTGGTPGTSFAALTVGAASSPNHERILRALQCLTSPPATPFHPVCPAAGAGFGSLFRPFGGHQTAFFSSRGPTADGRTDPDVVANGFASYGQGFGLSTLTINIGSGTSFSAPSVAGVAALLREKHPAASARMVRDAILDGANPGILADGSGPQDQGYGYVDGAAADALLQAWMLPYTEDLDGIGKKKVRSNIRRGADIRTRSGNVMRSVEDLLPGQRFDTYYNVHPNTSKVVVAVSDVTPGFPQNALFGDDIFLTVHSAKTSAIGEGDYKVETFTSGGTFDILDPEPGLMRVTLSGAWTNASPIDATVHIMSMIDPDAGRTLKDKIRDGSTDIIEFQVPPGAATLDVLLEWKADWGRYPTNDLDFWLIPPTFTPVNFAGSTLDSPERARVANPMAGTWKVVIQGFSILTKKETEKYDLRIAIDGVVQKLKKMK